MTAIRDAAGSKGSWLESIIVAAAGLNIKTTLCSQTGHSVFCCQCANSHDWLEI